MNQLTPFLLLALVLPCSAQVQVSGRITHPRFDGGETMFLSPILCFASQPGARGEARSFRSWETEPAGWYRIVGEPGDYTLMFTQPAHYFRPLALNHIFLRDGDKVDGLGVTPRFDFACFFEGAWDTKPATEYFQLFTAQGRSVTSVGFKFAHDGVDGAGPGGQDVLISVHRQAASTPDQWPQVGPTATVLKVDCGGPKNYSWSAAWNSGEVPLAPGETYAVRLRAAQPGGAFQAFWKPETGATNDCYRIGKDGSAGFAGHRLWLAVGTDNNGLLIPYNKRVHQQFKEFGGFANRWAQTYVAQGRSLASVILYAATGGAQPSLARQRVMVRVRQDGPGGALVGQPKIAIGNGNYTGDASWGMFGVAYAPGEVPLTPGQTYALEWESIENYETLHGFVNIKGQVSDDRPGFNPYRKVPPDQYEPGTAYKFGQDRVDFDLDAQIIEYEISTNKAPGPDVLVNGSMEAAEQNLPAGWRTFAINPDTQFLHFADGPHNTNHTARVIGGSATGKKVDGGFVQAVGKLNRFDTYLLAGQVRSSWPVDLEHQCWVGYDSTGQTENPLAETIRWQLLPGIHGVFVDYASEPIRPKSDSISLWLRARTTLTGDYRFTADFDNFTLRRVTKE